jgi:hypothetical protein
MNEIFLSQVMDSSFGHSISYNVYMAILLVPMLLLVSIRNLKYLSPVSMLANLLQVTKTFQMLHQQQEN